MAKCIDCNNARLVQYRNDPVIAICKFTDDKDVANSVKLCSHGFERTLADAKIEHM